MPRLGSRIPLIGRGEELRLLREACERAEQGSAGAVLLSGDAGVGKTRLVSELGEHAEEFGALVLTGRCIDMAEGGLPYVPFSDALAPLVSGEDAELVAAVRERPGLGRLFPQLGQSTPALTDGVPTALEQERSQRPTSEQDLGQLQLFDAMLGLLTAAAERRPVVLVIEDLHWADSSTRDLLSFLLFRLRTQRLLIVATYRHEDVHRRHPLRPLLVELARVPTVERVEVGAFTEDDARAFIHAASEDRLEPAVVADIVRRSEGNAFFVEELLASGAALDRALPAGLAEVLLARLERLTPAAQQLIRTVAAADGAVAHTALTDVAGFGEIELEEALREAVQHHVLVADEKYYSFRHALLREAVYGDLLPGERTRLHAAYAARLAGMRTRGVAAQLAFHSLQSNDLATALESSLRAATEAEGLGAPNSALGHVERALHLWDAVPAWKRPQATTELEVTRKASLIAGRSGQPDRAITYARAAVDMLATTKDSAHDREEAARTYLRLARALLGITRSLAQATEAIQHAWNLVAEEPPSHTRTWILAVRARILRGHGHAEEALASARTAFADARAGGHGGAEADALIILARLAYDGGDLAQARAQLDEAESTAGAANAIGTELMATYYRGASFDEQGELGRALAVYREGIARAEATGSLLTTYGIELRIRELHLRYVRGQWSDIDSVEPSREAMPAVAAALIAGPLAHVAIAEGRYTEARRLVQEMRPHVHTDLLIAIATAAVGSETAYWHGDLTDAVDWARAGLAWIDEQEESSLGGVRVSAHGLAAAASLAAEARLRGDRDTESEAVAAGEELRERARACAVPPRKPDFPIGPEGVAWLCRVEAETSRLYGHVDPELWEKTVGEFDYGAVYDQAVSRLRYAEALLGRQEDDRAAEQLNTAYEIAERLGAAPLLDNVRAMARRARVRLGEHPVEPERASTDPLTERERAVLELVALGGTNRTVGAELYISEKTVSVHLSRTMAKLGATRRAEAVAIAYDRGLLR